MKADQLRKSILQMAIQGKLVPQDTNDEPASVLLEKIRAEKENLIKQGKIKIEKPLPPITDDEKPFDIPDTWEWVRLGEISSYNQKKDKIVPKDIVGDMWSLDLEDIEKESGKIIKICKASERKISGDKIYFHKGQILYSKLRPYLKKILIAPANGVCSAEIVPFSLYGQNNPNYVINFLKSPQVDFMINSVTYGVKMPRVGTETMVNLLLPLPPLNEQMRIVETIEKFEPLLAEYDKLEQQATKLDSEIFGKIKKSVLQYAIQGKLVPQDSSDEPASALLAKIKAEKESLIKQGKIKKEKPLPPITDDEKPFDIPDTWEWVRFSDIFIFENGDRSEKYPKDLDLVEKGIPFWGAADMVDGVLRYSDSLRFISDKKFSELRSGKLLDGDFVCLLRGDVGKCAKFIATNECLTGFINAQMIIIRLIDLSLISYIDLILKSEIFKKQIKAKKTGTAVAQMAAKDLQSFLIPVPPLNEQKRIVARIEEIFAQIDKINC